MAIHTTNNVTEGNTTTYSINSKNLDTTNLIYTGKGVKKVKQPDGTYKEYNIVTSESLPTLPSLWRTDVIIKWKGGSITSYTFFDTTQQNINSFEDFYKWLNNHGYTNGDNPDCGKGILLASGYDDGSTIMGVYSNGFATIWNYTNAGDDKFHTSIEDGYIKSVSRKIF